MWAGVTPMCAAKSFRLISFLAIRRAKSFSKLCRANSIQSGISGSTLLVFGVIVVTQRAGCLCRHVPSSVLHRPIDGCVVGFVCLGEALGADDPLGDHGKSRIVEPEHPQLLAVPRTILELQNLVA